MTLILIAILSFATFWIVDFLCRDGPQVYFSEVARAARSSAHNFVRSSFRKLSQRQLRKDDRRLFAAGDRRAFA